MLKSDILLELHVPSFKMAKDFYGSIGFEVVWEKEADSKKKGYMVMRKGESILNFYCGDETVYEHSFFRSFDKNTQRGYGVEIILPIDGIENFYKEISKLHENKIVKELNDKYEKKDFRMVDPFGFYLRFVERYDWVNDRDKFGNKI